MVNQALERAGRLARADLIQNEADIANQHVAALQAQQQCNSARLSLLSLLAMDPHVQAVASDPLVPKYQSIDLEKAISEAFAYRMDLLTETKVLEQDRQALILARNGRLWGLDISGSFQRQTQKGIGTVVADSVTGGLVSSASLPPNSGSLGLRLSIPLGDYSLRQAEIHARIAIEKDQVLLSDMREKVEEEVRDAAQAAELSWQGFQAAELSKRLAQEAFRVERERLSAGRISNFEMLSYETSLRAAESAEISAAVEYQNSLTVLDQEVGSTLDTWKIHVRNTF